MGREGVRPVQLAKGNGHDFDLGALDTERFLQEKTCFASPLPGSYQGQRPILNLPVWQRQSGDGDFPALPPKAGSSEV